MMLYWKFLYIWILIYFKFRFRICVWRGWNVNQEEKVLNINIYDVCDVSFSIVTCEEIRENFQIVHLKKFKIKEWRFENLQRFVTLTFQIFEIFHQNLLPSRLYLNRKFIGFSRFLEKYKIEEHLFFLSFLSRGLAKMFWNFSRTFSLFASWPRLILSLKRAVWIFSENKTTSSLLSRIRLLLILFLFYFIFIFRASAKLFNKRKTFIDPYTFHCIICSLLAFCVFHFYSVSGINVILLKE